MKRVVIIEDELQVLKSFEWLLQENFSNEIDVVGRAQNVEEGIKILNIKKPDLVFMDVNLEGRTCFEILEKVTYKGFELIFTTAENAHAERAFDFSALDFMSKPVNAGMLRIALQKMPQKTQETNHELIDKLQVFIENNNTEKSSAKKIILQTQDGFTAVPVNTIVRFQSESNYTRVFLEDGVSYLASKTLKEFDSLLKENGFFRVHRSDIINLKHVKNYFKGRKGFVKLSDGSEIEVARGKQEEFTQLFLEIGDTKLL